LAGRARDFAAVEQIADRFASFWNAIIRVAALCRNAIRIRRTFLLFNNWLFKRTQPRENYNDSNKEHSDYNKDCDLASFVHELSRRKDVINLADEYTNYFKSIIEIFSWETFISPLLFAEGEATLNYLELINYLGRYGKVLTEHVGDKKLSVQGEDGLSDFAIHVRDMRWLGQSESVVAEVTTASLGVGYELGRIVERNVWAPEKERKRILCLYRPQVDKKLSAMIAGSHGIINQEYRTLDEAKRAIDEFYN
jgi:2'-deoxynucleoside 5'-phosphate N-hydrolase